MAITVTEIMESREVTDGQAATLYYAIDGTSSESDAIAALKATAPTTVRGLVRQPVEIEPIFTDTLTLDAGRWRGIVRYGQSRIHSSPTGTSSFAFDTGGGTQHITQSIGTVGSYPEGAPDHGGAIQVHDNVVEGVDIIVPVYQFTETHVLPSSSVTTAYKGQVFQLTGRVNDAAFKGCAAGECLFLGATGSSRDDGDWVITYRFAASPNKTGISVGSITGIAKKGWEYLWVSYALDEDAGRPVKKPIAAYVEKVYEIGSFALLGIGT